MPQQMDDELLQQAQAGEESAIAALITAMMPAIRKGAAAVAAPGLDFDDAVQEGLIGLFHAVRSYRADKKVPFTEYAAGSQQQREDYQRKQFFHYFLVDTSSQLGLVEVRQRSNVQTSIIF